MSKSHLNLLIVIFGLSAFLSQVGALKLRDSPCSDGEAGRLKCFSATQFSICPGAGQKAIIQNVAAGTQCQNNAIVAVASGSAKGGAGVDGLIQNLMSIAAPIPGLTLGSQPAAATPDSVPSSAAPPQQAPQSPNPCPRGGKKQSYTFNCRSNIAGNKGTEYVTKNKFYCLDDQRYTMCGADNTTVCLLDYPQCRVL